MSFWWVFSVNALQPKITKKLCILITVLRKNTFHVSTMEVLTSMRKYFLPWGRTPSMGDTGHLSKRVLKIWACVGDLGNGSRKWGFALNFMLSGSRGDSITDYLNKSFLEAGKNRVRWTLYNWWRNSTWICQDRRIVALFWGHNIVRVFSMFGCDFWGVLFCPHGHRVAMSDVDVL